MFNKTVNDWVSPGELGGHVHVFMVHMRLGQQWLINLSVVFED